MDLKTYSIYIIRNSVNDKVYIGQTSQSVKERFRQHLQRAEDKERFTYKIYNAMHKYGKDKFYVETLESDIPQNLVDQKEIEYIRLFDSFENGYNSTPGGDGKTLSKIEDIEKFKQLYRAKNHYEDIARYFHVSKETVRRTAEALKLPNYRNGVTEEYLRLNCETKTNIEMARELNVHPETISRALKRYGIECGKGCRNSVMPQNQKQLSGTDRKAIEEMWFDTRFKVSDIAKKVNVHQRTLLRYAKEYELPARKKIKKG